MVADVLNRAIHCVQIVTSDSKLQYFSSNFLVRDEPSGLSVAEAGDSSEKPSLIVAFQMSCLLREYTLDGQLKREIRVEKRISGLSVL